MKVLLYFEKQKQIKQSGIGRALSHQKKALELANVDYTLDPKEEFDFAHVNTYFNESMKLIKKCKKSKKIIIAHGHSTKEDFKYSFRLWRLVQPFYNRYILRLYRSADAIITPTEYSKSLISKYKGVNCPIYAISNGIMLEDYVYKDENVKAFDDLFKLPKDQKIVICAGLYFERKGIRDFFEIARKMPDVTFIWFGHLNKTLTQLKILRAIKKRPKNVLMPGYVDIKVLRGAFHRANCFLFLSYEENEGIAVLEAMASKLPVIVRDIPVFNPWLKDNEHVLKGKNNEEFIEKLNYIFNNDMSNMTDNAYKVVEERTLDKIGAQIKEVYERVYNKNNGTK